MCKKHGFFISKVQAKLLPLQTNYNNNFSKCKI